MCEKTVVSRIFTHLFKKKVDKLEYYSFKKNVKLFYHSFNHVNMFTEFGQNL